MAYCNIIRNVFLVGSFLATGVGQAKENARPNIIWMFSDDHSFQTIGAYGGRLKDLNPTPNIDRLASEGMRFDRCYVANSICAPSRATLLTGKHSHMNGKIDNVQPFNHDQQQVQKILRKNGYQTAMVGKIHLDGRLQGFDYWEVLPGQGEYNDPEFISDQGTTNRFDGYVTDIITDKAFDWLENKRDPTRPFMLMIHHKAPHRKWIPAARDMERYADVHIPEPNTLFDDYDGRGTAAHEQEMMISEDLRLREDLKIGPEYAVPGGPFFKRNKLYAAAELEGRDLVRWKYQTYMKDFLRCVWALDENVGRVLDKLDELGLSDNTVVMYSSDQGFYMGEHGWFDKRFMYEESFRTPFIVRWPGVVSAGSVNTDLVQNIDFAETFLDVAGISVPADMQGRSLVPLFKGERPADWRELLYYHYYEYPGWHSVRRHEGVFDGRYKLIRYYGPDVPGGEEWEFFDLETDPHEMKSIYDISKEKKLIQRFKSTLDETRRHYKVK